MSVYVLSIATMLGLGLGIDYALLAVSRFREELETYPIPEAVSRTVAAGRSIFFSGLAVLIGLSGLLFPVHVYPLYRGRRRRRGVRLGLRGVDAAASGPGRPRTQGERARGAQEPVFWGRSAELCSIRCSLS